MRRLTLIVTPDFERALRRFMKQRSFTRKSDAIRQALREAVTRSAPGEDYDYRNWLSLGLRAPLRRNPRFRSEGDLWLYTHLDRDLLR